MSKNTTICPRDFVPNRTCGDFSTENSSLTAFTALSIIGAICTIPALVACTLALLNHFPASSKEWKLSEIRVLACGEQSTALFILCSLRAITTRTSTIGNAWSVSISFLLWYLGVSLSNYLSSIHKFGGLKQLVHSNGMSSVVVTNAFARVEKYVAISQLITSSMVVIAIVLMQVFLDKSQTWCALAWVFIAWTFMINSLIAILGSSIVLRECARTADKLSSQQREASHRVVTYLRASRIRHAVALMCLIPFILLTADIIPCDISQYILSILFPIVPLLLIHVPLAYIKAHPVSATSNSTLRDFAPQQRQIAVANDHIAPNRSTNAGATVVFVRKRVSGTTITSVAHIHGAALNGEASEHDVANIEGAGTLQLHEQELMQIVEGNLHVTLENAGLVVGDAHGDADVSLLTEHEVDLIENDTIGHVLCPRFAAWLLNLSAHPTSSNTAIVIWTMTLIWYLMSQVIVALVLLGIWPPIVALVQIFNALAVLIVLLVSMSHRVAVLLLKTSFVQVRLSVAMMTTVSLCLALHAPENGLRALLVPALTLSHVGCFMSDGFVKRARFLRWLMICSTVIPTVIFLVTITLNDTTLVTNEILPLFGSFSFSSLQFCRDSLFATMILILPELRFLIRQNDAIRFNHLGRPVKREIIALKDSNFRATHPLSQLDGTTTGAARKPESMFVASGFFMAQNRNAPVAAAAESRELGDPAEMQENIPPPRPRRIYVDHVAISEYDAMAFHLFGESAGHRALTVLNHSKIIFTLSVINAVSLIFCLIVLSEVYDGNPLMRVVLCGFVLALEVMVSTREFMLKSRSLLRLMVRRPAFWMQAFCLGVWLVGCGVAFNDVRMAYPLCLASQVVQFLLVDSTTKPFRWSRNVFLQGVIACHLICFSMMLMTGVIRISGQPFVALGDFNTLDDPQVFDVVQTTIESGLASGVTMMLRSLWTGVWFDKDTFMFVRAPIRPRFD